jgi:hypothetical protein
MGYHITMKVDNELDIDDHDNIFSLGYALLIIIIFFLYSYYAIIYYFFSISWQFYCSIISFLVRSRQIPC